MTNKTTKRALLSSVLALVLCVTMLVGSTFAWFTDTATTSVNTIKAGTLDVVLEMFDGTNWVDAEGETLDFVDLDDNSLWEPGCTYTLPSLRVVNNGNLTFKYMIVINGIDADNELAKVLLVKSGDTVLGTLADLASDPDGAAYGYLTAEEDANISPAYTLSIHMPADVGNEYQGLAIEGMSVTVLATQYTDEYDSISNEYDSDAVYPVASVDQAEKAMASAPEGAVILLNDKVTGDLTVPANAKGITIVSDNSAVSKITLAAGAEDITLSGIVIDSDTPTNFINLNGAHGAVTLENCEISAGTTLKSGRAISGGNPGTTLVLDGCVIGDIGYGVYDAFSGYKELVITNSTFTGTVSWAIMSQGAVTSVTIDNCVFTNCKAGIAKLTGFQPNSTFTFTNNTMVGCGEHNPYGLFQFGNKDTLTIICSGNTFDGAEFNFD